MLDNEELYTILNNLESENKDIINALHSIENNPDFRIEANLQTFILLRKISKLGESFENGSPKFEPMLKLSDGRRSFSVDDMSDTDFDMLSEIDLQRLPVQLGILVADLLWFKRKDIDAVHFSIESYYNLYQSTFDYENWVESFEYIKRAITLSQKLNDNTSRNKFLKDVFVKLIRGNGADKNYFSIVVAEFLVEQKWHDLNPILLVMDNIINTQSDVRKSERAFDIKRNIFKSLKDDKSVQNNDCKHAEYLEQQANNYLNSGFLGLIQAETHIKKAIILYRNGKNKEAAEEAHKKLLLVQSRKEKEMPILCENIDVTNLYNHTKELFDGLTFEEHIVLIAYIFKFFSKEEIKDSIYDPSLFISKRYFGKQIFDKNGRTICEISTLEDNPTPEEEETHMFFDLFQKVSLLGSTSLKWEVQWLNERFDYSEKDLEFIVKDNCIVPDGRKRIFQKAIYCGLKGDMYTALHILAPQVENLFRNLAIKCGSNMSTINTHGIAEDKLLSSVFDDASLNECYDENIIFTFKELMNEKAGGNFRNRIAHGIMDECECNDGAALYFLCATIKLLSLTSHYAKDVLCNYFLKRTNTKDGQEN